MARRRLRQAAGRGPFPIHAWHPRGQQRHQVRSAPLTKSRRLLVRCVSSDFLPLRLPSGPFSPFPPSQPRQGQPRHRPPLPVSTTTCSRNASSQTSGHPRPPICPFPPHRRHEQLPFLLQTPPRSQGRRCKPLWQADSAPRLNWGRWPPHPFPSLVQEEFPRPVSPRSCF